MIRQHKIAEKDLNPCLHDWKEDPGFASGFAQRYEIDLNGNSTRMTRESCLKCGGKRYIPFVEKIEISKGIDAYAGNEKKKKKSPRAESLKESKKGRNKK